MNKLKVFFKGFFVGIANIVAGLSGSTIAVITNIYDEMLDLFANFIPHPLRTIKLHWRLIIGMLLGLVIGAFLLKFLYEKAPFYISSLFAGIVLAGVIPLVDGLKKPKFWHIIVFLIAFILILILPFITNGSSKDSLTLDFNTALILIGLGALSAASMIMPGVSGSMILMDFGYYDVVLGLLTDTLKNIAHLNFSTISGDILLILFFVIGCILGLIFSAVVIKKLLKGAKNAMDYFIFGLVGASFVSMMVISYQKELNVASFDTLKYIIGAGILIIGFILGLLINHFSKKKDVGGNDMRKLNEKIFLDKALEHEEEFKELLKNLVSYKSVLDKFDESSNEPFGTENRKCLEFILEKAKNDGFKTLNQDNYAGHIEYGNGNETLGVLAHLDVVPAVGNWNHDPFTLYEEDGKLYGRGVNDDKGPLAASYIALKILRELGVKPNKKVRLIMGCDEESGSRCLTHYFKYNEMPQIGFSPDACFPCINGEKAGAYFFILGDLVDDTLKEMIAGERFNIVPDKATMVLKKDLKNEFLSFLKENNYKGEVVGDNYIAYGLSAHAMTPFLGVNAAYILFEFLAKYTNSPIAAWMHQYVDFDAFGKKLHMDIYHDEMKELTVNLGIVRIKDGKIELGFDCRVPVDGHDEAMRKAILKSLEGTSFTLDFPPMGKIHYVPSDSELVKTLLNAYKMVSHDADAKAYTIGGGTYAKFIDNAVAFGPQFKGREDVDHIANEYIYIDDYIKTIAIYAKAIYDLVK